MHKVHRFLTALQRFSALSLVPLLFGASLAEVFVWLLYQTLELEWSLTSESLARNLPVALAGVFMLLTFLFSVRRRPGLALVMSGLGAFSGLLHWAILIGIGFPIDRSLVMGPWVYVDSDLPLAAVTTLPTFLIKLAFDLAPIAVSFVFLMSLLVLLVVDRRKGYQGAFISINSTLLKASGAVGFVFTSLALAHMSPLEAFFRALTKRIIDPTLEGAAFWSYFPYPLFGLAFWGLGLLGINLWVSGLVGSYAESKGYSWPLFFWLALLVAGYPLMFLIALSLRKRGGEQVMAEEQKADSSEGLRLPLEGEQLRSTLGERMASSDGMRILKDGKWILLSEYAEQQRKARESGDKPSE